jgi:type III pantothenate kinase
MRDLDQLPREGRAPHAPLLPATIALSSVVPVWTRAVRAAATRGRHRLIEATAATIPLPTRLAHPERAGSDRLLAAWTARELHGAPVVVVSLGTAATVDGVGADGAFAGGAILPGPELAAASLATGTAQLPLVPLEAPDHALGTDTVEAIQAGVILGHVEAVSGLIRRALAELVPARQRATVVLTGGLADAPWAAAIRDVDVVDPLLVIRGLAMLADLALGPAPGPGRPDRPASAAATR